MPVATSMATSTERRIRLGQRLGEAAVNGRAVRADHRVGVPERAPASGVRLRSCSGGAASTVVGLPASNSVPGFDGEQPRLRRTQVRVPVADRVAAVQDGGDLVVLAAPCGVPRRCPHRWSRPGPRPSTTTVSASLAAWTRLMPPARERATRASPPSAGRMPEGVDGVASRALRVGTGGGEVEVAVGGKRRPGLALGAAGDPAGLLAPRRDPPPTARCTYSVPLALSVATVVTSRAPSGLSARPLTRGMAR